jgi:HD-like signal output (HDOD) protein
MPPISEARHIVPVSEADPTMTARLLTLANSAFSGVRAQATNPSAAAMVVRSNVVRALAAAGSLGIQSNNSNVPPRLFNHALNSAAAPASLRGMPAFTRVRGYCTTSVEHYSFSAAGEK